MAILLEGKTISKKIIEDLKEEIAKSGRSFRLGIVIAYDHPAISTFVAYKQKAGKEIGIDVRLYDFKDVQTKRELRERIQQVVVSGRNDGIIIQLPLPPHIASLEGGIERNTAVQYILDSVPLRLDVDMLSEDALGKIASGRATILPPVVSAVKILFENYGVNYENGKEILLYGLGRLVGKPMLLWLASQDLDPMVVTRRTPVDVAQARLKRADIIISGVGKPGIITGDMVKEGVVIVDAGTSGTTGELKGDVDFESVREKASFITPTKGGVGPLTVAFLLKNLVFLAKNK